MPHRKRLARHKKPKHSGFVASCSELYNRLQRSIEAGEPDETLDADFRDLFGCPLGAIHLIERFDATVNTLQLNYTGNRSFRVQLTYTDRAAKPKHGYLYPAMTVVKTSRFLSDAITLAYLEICKRAGRQV